MAEITDVSIEAKCPKQLLELMWEVFFMTKDRGISLHTHFPWLEEASSHIWYVTLHEGRDVIGGLCVKEIYNVFAQEKYKVASIGLVCVAPEFRGRGYAKAILQAAIEEAERRNYDALTLWTSKHDVYAPQGFKPHDDGLFGTIDLSECAKPEASSMVTPLRQSFPVELGLPPFAKSRFCMSYKDAQAIFIQDSNGIILADWKGNLGYLVELLIAMPEKKWRINAHQGDQLLEKLAARGAMLNLTPSNLQMWLPLKPELANCDWPKLFRFSVLDRI